jgi:sugar lactone lactonase YvrE
VAVDGSGTVYVADYYNDTIRKITPAGVVTTLAGSATDYSGSADGTGSAARFDNPSGVAVDGSGNVYVADSSNHTIRKIAPAGVVTTLAGTAGSYGSADGTGSAARFYQPRGVAVDGSGNVYVADTGNHTIRKITPAGVVTTLDAARFYRPNGVAVDGSGNVYVADTDNHTIRKITPAGVETTLAGSSPGIADGTGSAARFYYPWGVAVDGSGNLYVADTYNHTIRKITPAGVVTTLAGTARSSGSADGTGSAAQFNQPAGVAVDGSGNVYVADTDNNTIRKITPAGVVTTLAGTATFYGGSADGTGSAARFYWPFGVAVDGSGNVYVADGANDTIRKITSAGVVTTLAGTAGSPGSTDGTGSAARFYNPYGVAVDGSGNVYVADVLNHTIRKITPAGVATTLAGTAGSSGSADGTGSAARFYYPYGVAVDGSGNVYVADTYNHTIRKITPAGVVTTLAGTPGRGSSVDGTGSAALFYQPAGVAVDGSGNVYVADTWNNRIRKITPAGVVTTLAGSSPGIADGTGSAARFNQPAGVAVDGSGNVYVADSNNSTIRKSVPAIDDAATIDAASGAIGITRLLGTAPKTATTWEWTLIRRPSGSTAELSSTSVENPTFTPDVGDLFVFRLTASSSAGARISTVSLSAAMSLTISLTPAAASIAVAGTATETVTLSATQPNPVTVNLTSSNVAAATVPASVTIPAGATTATFTITGVAPGSSTITGTLSAALGGGTATATATVSALTLTLTAGTGGATAPVGGTRTFTVTLSAAQGTATTITLSSSNTAVTTVPASVTIPAGSTSATFTVTSTGVGSANITASALGSTSILAFAASALTCTLAPATFNVSPGTPAVVTITLSQAQPGATTVTLASSDPSVTLPASVTISAGVASTTFNATTTLTTGTATITDTLPAALGGGSCTATATATLGAPAGDANGDGSVTVGDVFYLINYLFAGGPGAIGNADANGDGSVTVADVFYLINYLFAGGPAPH